MRLATWNLRECPSPRGERGDDIRSRLNEVNAHFDLLTEVHADWAMDGRSVCTSPVRVGYGEQQRLAGVQSTFTLDQVKPTRDHPGEEALCLVRARVPGSKTESVLVACSVLPWRGAAQSWSGLREVSKGEGLAPQFSAVLQHHVGRIVEERRENEPVVWGGDFNQELRGSIKAGTVEGRRELLDAFKQLDLEPLTIHSRHLIPELASIDHLAVSPGWMTWDETVVHGEPSADFPSDHALYGVEGA